MLEWLRGLLVPTLFAAIFIVVPALIITFSIEDDAVVVQPVAEHA